MGSYWGDGWELGWKLLLWLNVHVNIKMVGTLAFSSYWPL